jgi:hypothetical protein
MSELICRPYTILTQSALLIQELMEMAAAMEAEFEEAEGEARQEFESQREEIKVNVPPVLFKNVLVFLSLYFTDCSVPFE